MADPTPRIVETRTAASTVLVVVLETTRNETGAPSSPDVLDLDPAKWVVNNVKPLAVHRLSIPCDALPAIPGQQDQFPITVSHRCYVRLSAPLEPGRSYAIMTPYGLASLIFRARETYCESLRSSPVYSDLATARRVAFGIFMGDGGSLKLDAPPAYEVIDEKTGKVVFAGVATYAGDETTAPVGSGQFVYHLPLDKAGPGGPYFVSLPSCGRSRSFGIGGQFSRELATIAFKGLYHQRCGIALERPFTEHTRGACHTKFADTRAQWSSDGFINVPASAQTFPWQGGHHDAGDADLRPQHTIVARVLLTVFEALKPRFKDGQFGLPQSGRGVPDFLSESLWAVLAWENFQITDTNDPKFGGVRAGKEGSRHPTYGIDSMANDHTGTHGTWDVDDEVTALCAGIFAHASRLIAPYDAARATSLWQRAQNAYKYASNRNALQTSFAATVYASCQMYLASGIPSYHDTFKAAATSVVLNGGSWPNQFLPDNLHAKGKTEDFFSYLLTERPTDGTIVSRLRDQVFRMADLGGYNEVKIDSQPYSQPCTRSVGWGAWTASGRIANVMGYAAVLTTDPAKRQKYVNAASLLGDHALGVNGSGKCFLTGPWPDSPQSPLHLDSFFTRYGKSDGITEDHVGKPIGNVPGILLYGPSEGRSGAPYQKAATDKLYPEYEKLPIAFRDVDAWCAVNNAEFAVWETIIYSAALYGGFLYDVTTDTGATEPVPQPQEPPVPPTPPVPQPPPAPPPPPPAVAIVNRVGPRGEIVGSDVHYINTVDTNGAKPFQVIAAKVTQIGDNGAVALKLLYPSGEVDHASVSVPFSEQYKPGCWSWPSKTTVPVPVPAPAPTPVPAPTPAPGVLRVTEFVGLSAHKLKEISPGLIAIRDAEIRVDAGTTPRAGAQIAFTYRGPTAQVIALGDGTIRRQLGLWLRGKNTCNKVYAMWHESPTRGIHVSVKSNPGMSTHEQCRDRGYINNIRATSAREVPAFKVGERHVLAARIEGQVLRVTVDGTLAWEGTLPPAAFAFDGPPGIRSDNVSFDFELIALT